MYTILTVVLFTLGSALGQMDELCCPPNMTALGYNALHDFQYQFYYDNQTGDHLFESMDGHMVELFESSTGITYTRMGEMCTYLENQAAIGLNYCVGQGSLYLGEVMLNGTAHYEWDAFIGNFRGTLIVDDLCLTKIIHARLNDKPYFSHVLFNLEAECDVSRIHSFNKTGCVSSPST